MFLLSKIFSIDGYDSNRCGKLVNDSVRSFANTHIKKIIVDEIPKLCLFATKNISAGYEMRYDYGDVGRQYWWRNKVGVVLQI